MLISVSSNAVMLAVSRMLEIDTRSSSLKVNDQNTVSTDMDKNSATDYSTDRMCGPLPNGPAVARMHISLSEFAENLVNTAIQSFMMLLMEENGSQLLADLLLKFST